MTVINSISEKNPIFLGRKTHKNRLIQPTDTNMKAVFGNNNLEIMDNIRKAGKESGIDVFLFGGAVRDCLLNRRANDLDFIVNGDAIEFAKELNEKNGNIFRGVFPKPSVKRAVVYTKNMDIDINTLTPDGTTVKGQDNIRKAMIKKLENNDFSVNSMVIKLDENKSGEMKLRFFDYLKGRRDLVKNQLRHNDTESFTDDPIKALRGLRLKLKYGMKFDTQTNVLVKGLLKNPKVKKNKFYYRYIRECYRIAKELFKKLF